MEQLQQLVDEYWPPVKEFVLSLEPIHWAGAGGVLLILLVWRVLSGSRKRRARRHAPNLLIHDFQVAPLGRDAFLKFKNAGHPATLTALTIRGREDLEVKNAFTGHKIETGKVYGILLEAKEKEKINADFTVELTFLDLKGNVYQQTFQLDRQVAREPKLLRYGS